MQPATILSQSLNKAAGDVLLKTSCHSLAYKKNRLAFHLRVKIRDFTVAYELLCVQLLYLPPTAAFQLSV